MALRLGVRKPKCSYAFCSNVAPAATLAAAAGAAAAAAAVAAAAAGAIFYFNGISEGALGSFHFHNDVISLFSNISDLSIVFNLLPYCLFMDSLIYPS